MKTIIPFVYRSVFLSALALIAVAVTPASAAVLYSQTFDWSETTSNSVSPYGWNAYIGTTAQNVSSSKATADGNAIKVFGNNGSPAAPTGYLALWQQVAPNGVFAVVKTGLSLTNASSLSWAMSATGTSDSVRPMVQIGGTWYASNTPYSVTTPGGSDITTIMSFASNFTLDLTTASNWVAVTLTPGTVLSLDSTPVALTPSTSTITGIGFYGYDSQYHYLGLDTIAVTSIPEPTAAALALAGLALCFRRKRLA